MEKKLEQKELTVDLTTSYFICEMRRQGADVKEVINFVKQTYSPHYKEVTFTYNGCHYLLRDDQVFVQTMLNL